MDRTPVRKYFYGIVATILSAACITFLFALLYVFLLGESGKNTGMQTLGIYLFVGGVSAITALVVSMLTLLFVGIPLYVLAIRKKAVQHRVFYIGGILTSLVLCALLFLYHLFVEPLISLDFYFGLICIVFSCPVGASVFWRVVRPDEICFASNP